MRMTNQDQPSDAPRAVNLALQGGGSHGAFTWGVLDALLEHGQIVPDGISGTSAGAMNAVALAHGWTQDSKDPWHSARESLAAFWNGIIQMTALTNLQRAPFDILFGRWRAASSPVNLWAESLAKMFSPYQTNPLDINPLRDFLEQQIDFERLQKTRALKLFIAATRVDTGKAEIFSGPRVTAQAVMASACLPMMFQAVEIEGDHYWDGGYSANPPIHPLFKRCESHDVLLVQINPVKREGTPKTSRQILDRMTEMSFNASLLAEMRAIDFVNRLMAQGRLDSALYKEVFVHRIDGGDELEALGASSKLNTNADFIKELYELGRSAGKYWLKKHFDELGVKSSINIARDYLDGVKLADRGAGEKKE
jgi:NTE family protein